MRGAPRYCGLLSAGSNNDFGWFTLLLIRTDGDTCTSATPLTCIFKVVSVSYKIFLTRNLWYDAERISHIIPARWRREGHAGEAAFVEMPHERGARAYIKILA
jgi:hypothetical protein